MKYLEGRGLEKDIIEKFEIGLDPDDHYLCRYLSKHGFSDEEMIRANVGRLMDDGMHDVFYRRILFPIHNDAGEPVAFTSPPPADWPSGRTPSTGTCTSTPPPFR